ncbi:MAG TPA: NUDIX hydrolase [Candidatus Woesearchaeota archaeon]|nr:NUDIX hydrolase [Candidatus Woesearchaeota archaeon]
MENKGQAIRGTGAVITDTGKQLFYLQRKCEHYKPEEYRGAYAFFGGVVNDGESSREALERELSEDFQPPFSRIVSENLTFLNDFAVESKYGNCIYSLYECILEKPTLVDMSKLEALEGEGVLLTRDELEGIKMIYNHESLLREYLNGLR